MSREKSRGRDGEKPLEDWSESPSISPWRRPLSEAGRGVGTESVVDCGWGRVIFAHTFADTERLAAVMRGEERGKRDIAFYLPDPHVLTSIGPHEFFIDPSHTYRLDFARYQPRGAPPRGLVVRPVSTREECDAIHALYRVRQMVPPAGAAVFRLRDEPHLLWLIAVESASGRVAGVVLGIDHDEAFRDPEGGTSLWSLAVDPKVSLPGVGETLVRALAEAFVDRGRRYMDLSVMHDNREAIALYEKLGFERVPVFAAKRKNPINEPLFTAPAPEEEINPYGRIIIDEARRRGVNVEVLDAEEAYFRLSMGGRSVACRESLSELTSAVAMSRCDDKRVTHRVLSRAGLRLPSQKRAAGPEENAEFLRKHGSLVVKPRRGEQGNGVSVDVRTPEALARAVRRARGGGGDVLLEETCPGQDLRIIVIDGQVVAAAMRRPAKVTGTGTRTIRTLLRKQSRRRAAATGGESRIPLDAETRRCVADAGHSLDDVLPEGETLVLRKTANLHTGGTIEDVTPELHPALAAAARQAAAALDIPVVGLDLIVPDVAGPDYVIIEANERPGLANHEPQPTAERFLDFLFPQTRSRDA